MSTDFFDDDLSRNAGEHESPETSAMRLTRQKEQITNQVADTAEEIERLRMRQEELEHEKTSLEELNRKQDEYGRSKKDIIENLARNIILMEKDEVLANRMVELLSASRARFKDILAEIRDIKEESWEEPDFEEELDKALALIENARMEYSKAIAKIDAESWQKGAEGQAQLATLEEAGRGSIANKGFFFWVKVGIAVSLPLILVLLLSLAKAKPVEEAVVWDAPPSGNERILFVDDEQGIVKMATHMLTSLGYDPVVTSSSLKALEIFEENPDTFDILVTDQVMPDLTGSELALKVRAMRPNLPVVICSGFSAQLTTTKAEELGINEFLIKPISRRELGEAIQRALGADSTTSDNTSEVPAEAEPEAELAD